MELNLDTTYPLLLLVLAHVLGDFYLQWSTMAKQKCERWNWLIGHSLIYTGCMVIILCLGLTDTGLALKIALLAGVAHAAIDFAKRGINKAKSPNWVKGHIFTVDQCAHILSLIAICLIFKTTLGSGLPDSWLFSIKIAQLPTNPVTTLLGYLLVLRPIGLLIGSGDLWNMDKPSNFVGAQNGGKLIGYLERIIVLSLIMWGQYTAIAFVMTAKSIARFEQISKEPKMAEYYLIGTLFSIASVFVIALILGLAK